MRKLVISSAALLALGACGQQPTANESANASEAVSGTTDGALKLGGDGVPQFRAGAWEVKEAGEGGSETRLECLGPEAAPQLREMMTRNYPAECKVERNSSSERVYIKASCPQNGLVIDSEMDLKGSDTAFELKFGAFVTKPDGSRDGGVTTATSRWIGECPAGVQHGEEIGGAPHAGEEG